MRLLDALAQYLSDGGHGIYRTNSPYADDELGIVIGGMPATPLRAIALNVYGGSEADMKLPYDSPSIQVRVRGTSDVTDSLDRAQAIYDDWHGRRHLFLADIHILSIIGNQSGPIPMGVDNNGQHEHSVNFSIEYFHPTGGRQ